MTWTRLSDDFTDRPELLSVSRDARLLHVEALVWCNRMLTNGELPAAAIRRLTDSPDPEASAAELEEAGHWTADGAGGWLIDWTDQEDSSEVRKRREANAERQRNYRRRNELHQRGDHSQCLPKACPALRGVTQDVTRYVTTPRPDPSRPVPTPREGQGQRAAGTRSAGAARFGDHSDHGLPPPHSFEPEPDEDDLADPTDPCTRCGHGYRHLSHFAHDYEDNGTGICCDCSGREGAAYHLYAEKTGPGGGAV